MDTKQAYRMRASTEARAEMETVTCQLQTQSALQSILPFAKKYSFRVEQEIISYREK